MTTIKDLVVFKCLKVHQLVIEKKRVKAVYTLITKEGEECRNELIFSYNMPLFDKNSTEDINLASMMVAQVAINYGLFCEKIEFDGLYDNADKRFIADMVENTSREIYVNKFLHPTEFLVPPFDSIAVQKQLRYTAAEIVFCNTVFSDKKQQVSKEKNDAGKFVILSSGGKDSLLTYGIINEIAEAHPVFINESGRHWYTAYNAYQYFKDNEPNTVKPWCNSDRIFTWIAKQMPFIRPNFQQIRSDVYPIRLWTVAVFLFAALPVARKRNCRNILIGNEYDCTQKLNFKGISHYNSLYDQSKYFDNALTRYYHKKQWNMYQFSLLRSLSELLILKILVKRYPYLQVHQVSCHAAHKESEKMLPCGNCEKCRRIVGMLKALDEDPGRCGYSETQIEKCLKALEIKKVKQIGPDAAHLYHILLTKGLITRNEATKRLAKKHPEIMKLRFDNERSMMRDLPVDYRKKLFEILMKYADGCVKLHQRMWHNVSLNQDDFSTPYFINEKK